MQKRVLLVEDEVQLAYILKQTLEFNQYQVDMVHKVDDGLERIASNHYDCVISDYYLPEKSGDNLFKYVQKHKLQLPFIFMTGSPSLDFAVDFLKQGGAEYITKPFNLNDFVAKVNRVITSFQERENQQQFYASLRQKLDRRVREVTVYRDIYKSSADGYFIADLKREIIHVNAAFSAICGWQRKHLPMQMSEIFRFADGAEGNLENAFSALTEKDSWLCSKALLRKDGSSFRAELSIANVRDEKDVVFAYTGSLRDVTKEKEMEEQLLQSLQRINKAQGAIIFGLAQLAISREPETKGHLQRIRSYGRALARELQGRGMFSDTIDDRFIDALYVTAPLHDIGKVGIPDSVLMKRGRLSESEYDAMKKHTIIGAQTLQSIANEFGGIDYLQTGIDVAIAHHEKWDGSGYPNGLAGDEIPIAARIITIVDVYDALRTKRVYKPEMEHTQAMRIMREQAGSHFDPRIFDVFSSSPNLQEMLISDSSRDNNQLDS
jgi:PAS domain S-box-containing protein